MRIGFVASRDLALICGQVVNYLSKLVFLNQDQSCTAELKLVVKAIV